jgi:succinate dehydrogenase / fumarate reductase iron-sulfur subunit
LITENPPPDQERKQSPEEHHQFEDALRCILCACCTTSCPINQNKETEAYVGPAALVRAFRYLFDSRDMGKEERIPLLDQKEGAWVPDVMEVHRGLSQRDPCHQTDRPDQTPHLRQ